MAISRELTLEQLSAELQAQADQLARVDLTRAMKTVAVMAKSAAMECFQQGRAPDGTPWAPLARPRSRKRDKRKGRKGSDKPLLDTGRLQASVTGSGEGHVEQITATSLSIGTNLSYAAIHQEGGTVHVPEKKRSKPWVFTTDSGESVFTRKIAAHDVTVPARPYLGWSEDLLADAEGVFLEALEKAALP